MFDLVLDRLVETLIKGCYFIFTLVTSCAEDVPLAVLLLFCSEGDNIPDAFTLINRLNDWLHLLDNLVSDQRTLELEPLLSNCSLSSKSLTLTADKSIKNKFSNFLLNLVVMPFFLVNFSYYQKVNDNALLSLSLLHFIILLSQHSGFTGNWLLTK